MSLHHVPYPMSHRSSRLCRETLSHWGRVTHICVIKLTIFGSDNGLSPGRRQAIICTNARILLIRTLGTNFSEILSEILTFSFTKMRLKVSSAKCRPFCLGLNVLNVWQTTFLPQILLFGSFLGLVLSDFWPPIPKNIDNTLQTLLSNAILTFFFDSLKHNLSYNHKIYQKPAFWFAVFSL